MTSKTSQQYIGKLGVLYQGQGDSLPFQQLAERLGVPLYQALSDDSQEVFFSDLA